jgi:tRNA-splicing ligase RtcB (3'-phosphate/5'-hydroxy nucleic acid ligase)
MAAATTSANARSSSSPMTRRCAPPRRFWTADDHVAFLSHCGSRGFGNILAQRQFKALEGFFQQWGLPFPAGDKQLVYAPLGTPEADAYLDDMALGANFATVNHLLINALVLEAFQEVLPGTTGQLVYFISHNIARQEVVDNRSAWVHRKGATRAFPGGHHALADTPFADTGHPILLPGIPRDGSVVMVAQARRREKLLQREPRRRPLHGPQSGRPHPRSEGGRRRLRKPTTSSTTPANTPSTKPPTPTRISRKSCAASRDEGRPRQEPIGQKLCVITGMGLKARFVIKDSAEADD